MVVETSSILFVKDPCATSSWMCAAAYPCTQEGQIPRVLVLVDVQRYEACQQTQVRTREKYIADMQCSFFVAFYCGHCLHRFAVGSAAVGLTDQGKDEHPNTEGFVGGTEALDRLVGHDDCCHYAGEHKLTGYDAIYFPVPNNMPLSVQLQQHAEQASQQLLWACLMKPHLRMFSALVMPGTKGRSCRLSGSRA